ncbi:hypothetical protein Tco_1070713, partial [Tanacetum coccineum]
QLDGLKVENVSLKRRYDELSKANTHSRTAYTEKLSAFTAENTKLKAQVTGLLRCNIHTVIIDPHGIRANDDSKFPMQDMLISLLTYLKKSRKLTYKASAQSLKINVFFKC